jgi:hypothetical protein
LPTNPNTHPKEQQEAIKDEHPAVVDREKEKTKAAEREIKGERPEGTVVKGIEDDRLYSMLRRFDEVRMDDSQSGHTWLFERCRNLLMISKSATSCTQPTSFLLQSPTCVSHPCLIYPPTRTRSRPTSSE